MRINKFGLLSILALFAGLQACTLKHQIEPSDKPLLVNLNVKIDHEIKVKVQEQNKDLLDLEDSYLNTKKKKAKGKES